MPRNLQEERGRHELDRLPSTRYALRVLERYMQRGFLWLWPCLLLPMTTCASSTSAARETASAARETPTAAPAASPCTAPVSTRTWVGFSTPFNYDYFGEAALHAEQITALVRNRSCTLQPEVVGYGAYIEALSARTMVVATLTFTRSSLDTADVLVEPQDKSAPAPSFVLGLTLLPEGWQLTSITAR